MLVAERTVTFESHMAEEKIVIMSKLILTITLAGLVALMLGGCGSDTSSPAATVGTGSTGGTTPQAGTQEVTIVAKDNMFDPKTYTVEAGKSIRLTAVNRGQDVHEVEVKDLMPETKLSPGQSKTVDIQALQPGTYRIYCEIHGDQGMEGEFIVK
jgi:plastocyanin